MYSSPGVSLESGRRQWQAVIYRNIRIRRAYLNMLWRSGLSALSSSAATAAAAAATNRVDKPRQPPDNVRKLLPDYHYIQRARRNNKRCSSSVPPLP